MAILEFGELLLQLEYKAGRDEFVPVSRVSQPISEQPRNVRRRDLPNNEPECQFRHPQIRRSIYRSFRATRDERAETECDRLFIFHQARYASREDDNVRH